MTTENDTKKSAPSSVPPVPPVPPPPAATTVGSVAAPSEDVEAGDGVRAGAVKAARAALAAARDAAKRVQGVATADPEHAHDAPGAPPSVPPATSGKPAASSKPATGATPRADMHYTAAGVRFTADGHPAPPASGGPGAPGGPTQTAPARPAQPAGGLAGPRRVRLTVSRIDPWSVMKLAFLLAVAIAIMTVVAAAVFWVVVDGLGTFDKVQQFINQVVGQNTAINLEDFVAFDRVVSLATLVAIVNIVLLTAIATIMAILYNITAALVGGVHVTLTDD